MAMHLKNHKITYVSVPKCACSSLKRYFYEIDNGVAFEDREKTAGDHIATIHNLFPSRRFDRMKTPEMVSNYKLTVVRAPVSRIVSCYKNRVLSGFYLRQDGVNDACDRRGLPQKPDLQTFISQLSDYQDVSSIILQHSRPLSYFLGKDPTWFSAIFDMSEISLLEDFVREKTKSQVKIPHFNTSILTVPPEQLTPKVRGEIEDLFAEDTALFGKWMRFA